MRAYAIVESLSRATAFTSSMEAAMVATSSNFMIRFFIDQGHTLRSCKIGDEWYVEVRRDICGENSVVGLIQEFGTVG